MQAALGDIVPRPLVHTMWEAATEAADRGVNLGVSLATGRHAVETAWGINNLEVPLSAICQSSTFQRFASMLIESGQQFHGAYNSAILDYRHRHRLRSATHPAPLLAAKGPKFELPFWLWNRQRPYRQPLYVKREHDGLHLLAGTSSDACIRVRDGDDIAEQLRLAEVERGIKLRPRALVTTLYLRLVMADLFLHGIGGGRYDEVTDDLMTAFFHCPPPHFLVVSATYRLPCRRLPVEQDDVRQMDGMLRELWYHPDKHIEQVPIDRRDEFAGLRKIKRELIQAEPSANRKAWNDRVENANQRMRSMLTVRHESLVAERNRLVARASEDRILRSREYSFCLFSGKELRPSMTRWIGKKL